MLKRASILFVIISIILIGPYFSFIQSKSISNSDTIFIEYGTSQNKILNLIAPSNVLNKLFLKIYLRLNFFLKTKFSKIVLPAQARKSSFQRVGDKCVA